MLGYALLALPELVEAAARCGRHAVAASALRQLRETTDASRTDWGLGMAARSRALLSAGTAADDAYQEAITLLGRTGVAPYLARTHLVYGEWLRRERRRVDARAQLRTAAEMLHSIGAEAFALRAERELAATGERLRKRDARPDARSAAELTPQEAQIARLASDGQSNPEIAGRLFISPRTVEYHLHKVYSKLGISSRGQLARTLGAGR
jgi:DNA-binding CsgD family transcriptional regulator